MMQVTRAAFQAKASLNQQATDTKSHTLVRTFYTRFSSVPLPANSDGRHHSLPAGISPEFRENYQLNSQRLERLERLERFEQLEPTAS
jgi:hypothetical protein